MKLQNIDKGSENLKLNTMSGLEKMHAEKEMTAKEKQRLIYEEYQRKRKMELAEEKVRQENMVREIQAHQELFALRTGLAIPKSSQPEQSPAVQNSQIERGTDGNDVVRIQLTKFDGSKMLMSTSAKKTISELWDEIENKYKDVDRSQCHLVQRFPRKVFAEESMSSSLQSLGLTPTANLGFEKSGRKGFKASADVVVNVIVQGIKNYMEFIIRG